MIRSKFYSFKFGYLEDKLCNKGVLFAELDVGSAESIIVGTTHLQAPTGNNLKGTFTWKSNIEGK